MSKKKPPKVKIERIDLDENTSTSRFGYVYSTTKLIEHSKKYKVFDMPLAGFSLAMGCWEINNYEDFIHHMNRCKEADLQYPILLDDYGDVADGRHRMCKAILEGHRTIKTIRLETMPPHDRVVKKED